MPVRYQDTVVHADNAAKAGCYHCLKNAGGLVDLDLVIEGEGRLFICRAHAEEVAKVLGFIKPEDYEDYKTTNAQFAVDNAALLAALRDKEELIAEQALFIAKHLRPDKVIEAAELEIRDTPPNSPKPLITPKNPPKKKS